MMVQHYNTRVKVPNQASQTANTDSQESHDAASSNPTGRDVAEYSASRKGTLLRCKNSLLVATMNVRTARMYEKREELAQNLTHMA